MDGVIEIQKIPATPNTKIPATPDHSQYPTTITVKISSLKRIASDTLNPAS